MDAVAALLSGKPFLEQPTVAVPVIYLTEERPATIRQGLDRVGLSESDHLLLVFRQDMRTLTWPKVCERTLEIAERSGAGLVVVDTLANWSGLTGDAENDSGAALEAMQPLEQVAEEGLAVLANRHGRKSGGELGDSARGSSAFGGLADILLSLERQRGKSHPNRRELQAVGRFGGAPPRLVVEMKDGHYTSLGSDSAVEYQELRKSMLGMLPLEKNAAIPEKELLESLGERGSRTTVQRVLRDLQDEDGIVSP